MDSIKVINAKSLFEGMKNFLEDIKSRAIHLQKTIVLSETNDQRIIDGARVISDEKIANIILIETENSLITNDLRDRENVHVINPESYTKFDAYANELVKLRGAKGMTLEKAQQAMKDPNYFGTMMVHMNDADGLVSGATHTTADTVRPALQIIKTKEKFHKVSSFFFMLMDSRIQMFADCAININPDAKDLAEIALDTARSAKKFNIDPKIAMLSFSTKGSAKHPFVDKVREAVNIVKHKAPELMVDGEMQVDAALVPEICKKKCGDCAIDGHANVLIFPDLQSGNIAYKLVERLAGAEAIGPILQGLNKPVNDLSRGCKVEDVVNVVAITALESEEAIGGQ